MAVAVFVYINVYANIVLVFVIPEWVLTDFPQVHVGEPLCMSARCAYIICSVAVHLPYREGGMLGWRW